ncbi:hypothetical protein JMJ77_0005587 [Colletotrichum scovillei]|uniref:Uncharacterized protein n=1 Tax=Colletotrichum scovillei TaxID=1209932 RepID=A0A9P7UHK6_9PEZI|nr:hypothetical protein JMJ77_0005587 [Colletotrichum scovillei]KAG7076809.1 hypothetical protein JMJ76_0014068 [Colletotrichum scovillei]KAG7083812.1 hypothetical protein JMJ78_0009254 [Colletotrichum scovillei]
MFPLAHEAKGPAAGPKKTTSFRSRTTHMKQKCDGYISASFEKMIKDHPKSSNEDLWTIMEERRNRFKNKCSSLGIGQKMTSGTRLSESQERRVEKMLEDVNEDLHKVQDILLKIRNNRRMIDDTTQEEKKEKEEGHDSELYQSLENIKINLEIDFEKDSDRSLSLKERGVTFSKDGTRVSVGEFKV